MPKTQYEDTSRLAELRAQARATSKAAQERAEIREMLANLPTNQVLRVSPDGESSRKLKRMVTEAAKELNKKDQIKYVTDGDDLLVFMVEPAASVSRGPGRPRKTS